MEVISKPRLFHKVHLLYLELKAICHNKRAYGTKRSLYQLFLESPLIYIVVKERGSHANFSRYFSGNLGVSEEVKERKERNPIQEGM